MKKEKNRFNSILDTVAEFIVRLFTNEKILMTTKVGKVTDGEGSVPEPKDIPKEEKPKRVRKSPVEKKVAVRKAKKKVDENASE